MFGGPSAFEIDFDLALRACLRCWSDREGGEREAKNSSTLCRSLFVPRTASVPGSFASDSAASS